MVHRSSVLLSARALVVGTAADCDVVVEHRDVAPHHACVWARGRRVYVASLGGKDTRLDGCRVHSSQQASSGAVLELGDAPALRLVATEASPQGRRFMVTYGTTPYPWVKLEHTATGAVHSVRSAPAIGVAWLLAHQLERDTRRLLPPDDRGWIDNEELEPFLTPTVGDWLIHDECPVEACIHHLWRDLAIRGLPPGLVVFRPGRTRLDASRVGLRVPKPLS